MNTFDINLNINIRGLGLEHQQMELILANFKRLKEIAMANQAETAQSLRDMKAQADKSQAEIIAKVQAMQAAIDAAGTTTPEIDAAMTDLKTAIQGLDDLNPDTPDAVI